MGTCYDFGEGVEKDMTKAIELYRRAIDLNNLFAMNDLAICYLKGEGVEKDIIKNLDFKIAKDASMNLNLLKRLKDKSWKKSL